MISPNYLQTYWRDFNSKKKSNVCQRIIFYLSGKINSKRKSPFKSPIKKLLASCRPHNCRDGKQRTHHRQSSKLERSWENGVSMKRYFWSMKLYLLLRGTWPICPCWWRHLLWQVCSRSCSRSVDISHAGLGHIGRRTEAGRSVRNILSMSKTTSDFRFRVHYSLINWNTSNHLNLRPFTLPYHEDSEHLVVMPGADWRHWPSWRLLSSRPGGEMTPYSAQSLLLMSIGENTLI